MWKTITGEEVGKSTLPNRYSRLKSNLSIFPEDDCKKLVQAKQEIEENFEKEKWNLIKACMEKNGVTNSYTVSLSLGLSSGRGLSELNSNTLHRLSLFRSSSRKWQRSATRTMAIPLLLLARMKRAPLSKIHSASICSSASPLSFTKGKKGNVTQNLLCIPVRRVVLNSWAHTLHERSALAQPSAWDGGR